MARISPWSFSAMLFAMSVTLPAYALDWPGKDNVQSIMADCSRAGLTANAIDDCLERARVLDESNPSPQLQSLKAQLERQADTVADGTPAGTPSAPSGPTNYSQANSGAATDDVHPTEIEGNDPPPPEEPKDKTSSGADSSDAVTGAEDIPAEVKGPDEAPPPVEDEDKDDTAPPDSSDSAPAPPHG